MVEYYLDFNKLVVRYGTGREFRISAPFVYKVIKLLEEEDMTARELAKKLMISVAYARKLRQIAKNEEVRRLIEDWYSRQYSGLRELKEFMEYDETSKTAETRSMEVPRELIVREGEVIIVTEGMELVLKARKPITIMIRKD